MEKAQYAIMRFAKYKGPEIGNIEAHNERTKEKYASNPDVDTSRSKYNFHLVKPPGKYRAESERQIAAAGCRTRKDSIRMIETLFTASPEFFKGKKRAWRMPLRGHSQRSGRWCWRGAGPSCSRERQRLRQERPHR